ncbi:MAG TPA: hypothetical protein VN176_05765 [Verrucomicrobiae bacterium]|nr:hypothetical protein [Verrucomicrobiae bacterium]
MNVFFCLWLWLRAKMKHDRIEVMFHEVWLSFGISWKGNVAATVHRVMVALLKRSASKIWISGEAWRPFLNGAKAPIGWLPVPSNVPGDSQPECIAAVRRRCCEGGRSLIVGHLGIGSALVEQQLRLLIPGLLREEKTACFLLIGQRSESFSRDLQNAYPDLAARIACSGILTPDEISAHIGACDLMVQPYVDGISTRRGAAMAAFANGRALLTTSGHSTEPFWLGFDQLAIVRAGDTAALIVRAKQLLTDDRERSRMAVAGKQLYQALFNTPISAQVLRGEREPWSPELIEGTMSSQSVLAPRS